MKIFESTLRDGEQILSIRALTPSFSFTEGRSAARKMSFIQIHCQPIEGADEVQTPIFVKVSEACFI